MTATWYNVSVCSSWDKGNARSVKETSQWKRDGICTALSRSSKAERTHCLIFSFCIRTATGSCITKIVGVSLPPKNYKGVLKGLSRVRGNSYARFLGEGVSYRFAIKGRRRLSSLCWRRLKSAATKITLWSQLCISNGISLPDPKSGEN